MNLLTPHGVVASAELTLMKDVALLMLIIAVAVFSLAFFFAYWYRAGNKKAVYLPDWEHGAMSELVWWMIPIEIVLVLGALTWNSTHALDPHKALASPAPILRIEVVALPWKWLFIYPDAGVATVNELEIPVGRPIEFDVTADAPMNSFWIPELGGQIYAMSGMATELNLMASAPGTYEGRSANYSGEGFAGMQFTATAVSEQNFEAWLAADKNESLTLTFAAYKTLAAPSENYPPTLFGYVEPNLFAEIMMQYMSTSTGMMMDD